MASQAVIDDIAAKEAASKQQSREFLTEIIIDDVAQKAAITRNAMARGYAMDPAPYSRPYPGSSVSKQVIQAGSGVSGLLGPLLASLGTAGAILGGTALLQAGRAPTPQVSQDHTQTSEVKPIDLQVKWWYEGEELKSEVIELTPEEAARLKKEKDAQK